jgi:uncharacterized membrane protein HdeD (DUF308 family)
MTRHRVQQAPLARNSEGALGNRVPRVHARHWPWLLTEGVLGVAVGLLALLFPALTVLSLALLLGVGLLLQGAIGVFVSLGSGHDRWWRVWTAVFGVLSIAAGLICIIRPGTGVLALVFGLVLWFVLAGINDLARAAGSREHRGWTIALGVLALVVAAGLLTHPVAAISTLALFAGLGFLIRGGLDVGLGFALRHASR